MAASENDVSAELANAFSDFAEELAAEGDRAAVILGAAKLDDLLLLLLAATLLPPLTNDEDLLDGDRPLSTFSARITACYRLGIVNAELAKTLHLLRKLRNDFAHKMDARLSAGVCRDRAKVFVMNVSANRYFDDVRKVFFPDMDGLPVDFRAALTTLAIRLHTLTTKVTRLSCLS